MQAISHRLRTASVLVSLPLVFVGHLATDDFTVTAIGSFFCYDGNLPAATLPVPLRGARVQLMDSDCDGSTICDDVMGESVISDNGTYKIEGRGGDPGNWSWSRPDVYIRVLYNDGTGVRLTDELDNDQYANTPEHDHDNTSSATVDFGSFTVGTNVGAGNSSKCGVWLAAHRVYGEYVALMGEPPPAGHWDIEYWAAIWAGTPWTNTNTSHWPIHSSSSAAAHEFGHSIRHAADGDRSHFDWDVTRFRYARNHSRCDANSNRIGTDTRNMGLAYGFNEGWAHYWSGATGGCSNNIDEELEGNIAWALDQLSMRQGVGRVRMVQVLKDNPGKIHSLDDFVRFLAPSVGSTSSALTKGLQSARARKGIAPGATDYRALSESEVLAGVRSQVEELTRSVRLLEQQLALAEVAARSLRPCRIDDCEKVVRAATLPVMLRADLEVRRLALRRFDFLAGGQGRALSTRRLASGGLDSILAQMREANKSDIRQIYARATATASRETTRLTAGSPVRGAFSMEFAALTDAEKSKDRGGRASSLERAAVVRLTEERATPGRKATP